MSRTCTANSNRRPKGRPPHDQSERANLLRQAFPPDRSRREALATELGIAPSHLRKIINQGLHVRLDHAIALAQRSGLSLEMVLGRRIPRGLKIWSD